jgi:hypothetical protein
MASDPNVNANIDLDSSRAGALIREWVRVPKLVCTIGGAVANDKSAAAQEASRSISPNLAMDMTTEEI